ncbi:MAG: hypothetical protein WBS54_00245 [Acidobacteriota bacterium]
MDENLLRDMREDWPESWMGVRADLEVGRRLVEEFIPFAEFLHRRGYAKSTLRRHVDSLWVLGGELVKRASVEPSQRALPARALIEKCVGDSGGPLLGPYETEGEQRTLDATCRLLWKFMALRAEPQEDS